MQEIYSLPDIGFEGTFESYTGLVHPDDKAAMIRNYEDFKASGASLLEFADRIVRRAGRVVHVRGTGEIAQTSAGFLLTGVVQDITQEIEQGSRLALHDHSVRRLNDVVIIFEAIDGPGRLEVPIVYVNPAFLRITGLERADVLGQPVSEVMAQTVPGVPFEVLSSALSHPVSLRSDIQLYARDGRIVPAEIDLVPVTGQDLQLTHWIAAIRDMLEKFAAKERARVTEERCQPLSRSTHDVVWDWDFVNRRVTWNENVRQIAGYPAAPLVAAPASWADSHYTDDCARVLAGFFGAAADDTETWFDEYRFRRDDGEIRCIFDRGFTTRDASGKALHIIGSMVDITAQKQAEARLAQSEKPRNCFGVPSGRTSGSRRIWARRR